MFMLDPGPEFFNPGSDPHEIFLTQKTVSKLSETVLRNRNRNRRNRNFLPRGTGTGTCQNIGTKTGTVINYGSEIVI